MQKKLQVIAEERGERLDTLIPRMVKEHGSVYRAAVALNVYPNAIYNWLRQNGYRAKRQPATVWVKKPEPTR